MEMQCTHTWATRLGLETVLRMTAFAAAFFHLDFARPAPPAAAPPSSAWALSGISAAGASYEDTGLDHTRRRMMRAGSICPH